MIHYSSKKLIQSVIFVISLAASMDSLHGKDAVDPALKREAIGAKIDSSKLKILPWPMSGKASGGQMVLGRETRIVVRQPGLLPLAEILSEEITRVANLSLSAAQGTPNPGDIFLRMDPNLKLESDPHREMDAGLKHFAQRVRITPRGAVVEGDSYQAVAMASAMFLQTMEVRGDSVILPGVLLEDRPGSQYCGIMLDVARQWHPIEILHQAVDLCRLYRVPYFHIHFTDDQAFRLPSKSYPKLPQEGESYSHEEIEKLVAYADARGVTIIPEIDLPGHSRAMQKSMPEIFGAKSPSGAGFDELGVINIANEEVYPVLETLIRETCELFESSPYFHIGADETNFGQFHAHAEVQKQLEAMKKKGVDTQHIFAHFINQLNAMVKSNGKKTLCWEGFSRNEPVDKDIIVMAWHGSCHAPGALLDSGYQIINVPWTPAISWTARQNYEWNKWLLNLNEQLQSHQFDMNPAIIGGQMVLWEKGPNDAIEMLRGKVPARHERLSSPWSQKSYEDYAIRFMHTDGILEKILYGVEVELKGLTNTEENLYADDPVEVSFKSPIKDAKIYYTINGQDPGPGEGELYKGPFKVDSGSSKQVFINGYYGPRTELRVRVFGEGNKPLGGVKWLELRCEKPRLKYQIYEPQEDGKFGKMPDFSKIKPVASGKLARLESSYKIASPSSGALALLAEGTMEIRTPGEYKLLFRGGRNLEISIGGKDLQIHQEGEFGKASVDLPVGMHPIIVKQYADDGGIGVRLTMEQAPPDPENNARHFNNEYIHLWMTFLDK